MRKRYEANGTTSAILQTNTFREHPYEISTILIDLPDASINILVKGNNKIAQWLWKLITDDLKRGQFVGSRRLDDGGVAGALER